VLFALLTAICILVSSFQDLIFNFCIQSLKSNYPKKFSASISTQNSAVLPPTDSTTNQAINQSWAIGHPTEIPKSGIDNSNNLFNLNYQPQNNQAHNNQAGTSTSFSYFKP